jgi:hypothetical protein
MQTMIHPCPPGSPKSAKLKASVLALLFAIAGPGAIAQLDGEDNFNDNSRDPAKWATPDTTFGNGLLIETNQRLHYLTSGTAGEWGDYATRQWQTNYGRFTDNWEVQLDVNLPALTLDEENEVEIGLGVGNVADLGDSATITLNTYRAATVVARQFWSDIRTDNSASLSDVIAATTATNAAVRIRWTAATRTLSFEYDANGAVGGYTWALLTARIIGEGGYDWDMTDTSQFGVAVFGASYAQDLTLASSVSADNFLARSEIIVLAPRLSIVPAASGSATISWTPAPPGWVLQENLNLATTNWVNSVSGATNPVVVPATSPQKFYRLFKR